MSTRSRLAQAGIATALVGALLGTIPGAVGAATVVSFDGSPGTGPPPATLGGHAITPFALDTRPLAVDVSGAPSPVGSGTVTFSPALRHQRAGSGTTTWSHGFRGDVYRSDQAAHVVLGLPAGTVAFRLYADADQFARFTIAAAADDGTTSSPIAVNRFMGARYFGFFAGDGSTIARITITSSGRFAVGEFGLAERSTEAAEVSIGAGVTVWLNAFIPDNVPRARPVPAGPHAGETFFPGPLPASDCFATDQRTFSNDVTASARLHAETRFDIESRSVTSKPHRSTATVAVACANGTPKCLRTATPSGQFSPGRSSGAVTAVSVTAAASNPCFPGSPNVDFNGTLGFTRTGSRLRVTFVGNVEAFPNFEMYVSLNGGDPQMLFQRSITGGLLSLFGAANVPVRGTATFPLG